MRNTPLARLLRRTNVDNDLQSEDTISPYSSPSLEYHVAIVVLQDTKDLRYLINSIKYSFHPIYYLSSTTSRHSVILPLHAPHHTPVKVTASMARVRECPSSSCLTPSFATVHTESSAVRAPLQNNILVMHGSGLKFKSTH